MKTNKDLIFTICVIIWLYSTLVSYTLYKLDGVKIHDIICILLFSLLNLAKYIFKTFNNWLEKPLKTTN